MRRLPLLVAVALASCNAAGPSGQVCGSDSQCDPGDLCSGGECTLESAIKAGSLSASPSSATVTAAAADLPAAANFTLNSSASKSRSFAVACDSGASATPASGKVSSRTSASIVVQAAPAQASTNITCLVTSPGGKSGSATFTLNLVVQGGGTLDGGGDGGSPEDAGDGDGGLGDGGLGDGGLGDGGLGDGGANDGGSGGSAIGPAGGAVDLLDFVMTGDTRPPTCDDTASYPAATLSQIVQAMGSFKPQFGLDLGDHMNVCSPDASIAQAQMDLYLKSLQGFPSYFAMTMGNHECQSSDCAGQTGDVNYAAFLAGLKQVSKQVSPNYALQIQTRLGRATVVFVADNSFDSAAQDWLASTLADADVNSKYTIIAKHHPVTGSRSGPPAIWAVIQAHRYSLILMSHNHDYEHTGQSVPSDGRGVICGLGGANTSHTGFCRVQQQSSGSLAFTQYDASGNPGDSWSVAPQ